MELNKNSSLEDFFNAFIADEMWAALNYKNASFASKGKALKFANGIFENNSDEEFEHMEELVDMAKSLSIAISFNLESLQSACTTPYYDIDGEEDSKKLVEMFIDAEKRAISGYELVLKSEALKEKPELCQFFGEICNDEHDHLAELEDCLSNIAPESASSSTNAQTDDEDDVFSYDDNEDDSDVGTDKGYPNKHTNKDDDGDSDSDEDDDDDNDDSDNEDSNESVVESFELTGYVSMSSICKNVFESSGK